jgi:hypothetical protein
MACTGYIAYSGSDRVDRPCPNESAGVITAGCVHEHVGEHELCPMHADEAREGVLLCGDCLNTKGAPHRCYLRVLASRGCPR